jgi:hypothetical protein
MTPLNRGLQIAQIQLDDVRRQRVWADGPLRTRSLAFGGASLADSLPHLVGVEAHQPHQGLIAEQQGRQGMHALHAVQGLQPIKQDILHAWHHHPLHRRPLDIVQPVDDSQLVQEVEEIIQQRPFVQSVDPVDDLFAVQATGYPRVIAASRLPTQVVTSK